MGSILVQKYGGSSVADVGKIAQVAEKVVAAKRAGHDVVVVVSAMGKTTDELLALAKRAAAEGLPGAAEAPRRELDMLVSTGERVTMALLSIAIAARGCEAISFTGSQSGILTNDRHFDARIIEVRPHRIEDELARGKIVIVAGYQGMSYKREITTLGRGGSDTTAVALAAALGAERCEIYSDVDGVYSADPRVVPDAKHLPEVDLASLQEMAEAGAKVLGAQAVEWARRTKIAIHARKTSDPVGADGSPARQTVAREQPSGQPVRAVVGLDHVASVRVRGRLAPFGRLAEQLGLPLLDLAWTGDEVHCAVPLMNVPDWASVRAELDASLGGALALEGGQGLVSVVGHGLTTGAGVTTRFAAALDKAEAAIKSVHAGPLRIGAMIASDRLAAAQQVLHDEFVRG